MYFKAKKTKTRSTGKWWYWHPHRGPHCKAQLLYPPLIHKNPESTTTSNLTTFLLTALVRASCCVSSGHRKQHLQIRTKPFIRGLHTNEAYWSLWEHKSFRYLSRSSLNRKFVNLELMSEDTASDSIKP
jgi:hypothetical protein